MTRLGLRVAALHGWRRFGLALLLGSLTAAAFAPLFVLPALLAFGGLLWLLDGAKTWRAAFGIVWCFAFGHFAFGLYWTGLAFLVDVARFAILLPFPILGLPAALALIPAICVTLAWLLPLNGARRGFAVALAWVVAEFARGHLLTGFPWNLVGHAWAVSDVTLQAAAWFGVYGLSLLTLVAVMLLARRHWLVAVALLMLVPAIGLWRLADATDATVPDVRLRLVQAAIDQREMADSNQRVAHVRRQIELSLAPSVKPPTHVIWPESAIPFFVEGDGRALAVLAGALPLGGVLLSGAPRRTPDNEPFKVWNSLLAIDDRATVLAGYDKRHLVPFGEYLPLRPVLGLIGIDKLVPGSVDFSFGTGPAVLEVPGLPPARILVCYEAIFPGEIEEHGMKRPGLLLNITNDGWFGRSSGPYQHLTMARFRAVEQGLPLVRAANTGVSVIADANGRITARLGLGETGVIDGPLPVSIAPPPYARFGEWLLLAMAAVLGAGVLALRSRH